MPINRIYCPNCGSNEIEEVGIDQYKCKVCSSRFNFTRPNDGLIIQDTVQHNCNICGIHLEHGKAIRCTTCENTKLCENCAFPMNNKMRCIDCFDKYFDDIVNSNDNMRTIQKSFPFNLALFVNRFWGFMNDENKRCYQVTITSYGKSLIGSYNITGECYNADGTSYFQFSDYAGYKSYTRSLSSVPFPKYVNTISFVHNYE